MVECCHYRHGNAAKSEKNEFQKNLQLLRLLQYFDV